MADPAPQVSVRNTTPRDFNGITELCRRIYPETPPWNAEQLSSHLRVFPEGQFVAVYGPDETVVGMTASLMSSTLYGAEVIVDPTLQHHGIGDKLYGSRRSLTESLTLRRIRAGSRLRGYHECAARLKPEEYVTEVVEGVQYDPTLSFQLQEGFHVLAVVPHYLSDDPESPGVCGSYRMVEPAAHPAGARRGQAYAVLAQKPCRGGRANACEEYGHTGEMLTTGFLSNDQYFANVVAAEEELDRGIFTEKIFDMPVVEDALQFVGAGRLQFQGVLGSDVVAVERSFGAGVLGVEEGQHDTARFHGDLDALDERLHQRLGQKIGEVPEHDRIEFLS